MQCPFSNCVVNVLLKHFDLKITFLRRTYTAIKPIINSDGNQLKASISRMYFIRAFK